MDLKTDTRQLWLDNLSLNQIRWLIASVAAVLFIPFLDSVHLFDWDEINFAEAAREMIVSGNYLTVQINFQPFWEKPPLFIYLQVIAMKIFGVGEFAARLPNALCGIITAVTLFNIGNSLRDKTFGVLWTLAYCGSILPFLYFKSGIIDPWFNLFIFLGIHFLLLYFRPDNLKNLRTIVLAATFAGLAIMTKGPVGILLIALSLAGFLVVKKFSVKIKFKHVIIYLLIFLAVGGFWFIIQIIQGNYSLVADFIQYQIRLFQTEDASHGGFFGYHFVVIFLGVFPTSILALRAFSRSGDPNQKDIKDYTTAMIILFWVVLILFSIVKTKILHYSSLAYFPVAFLAADFVYHLKSGNLKWARWQSVMVFITALLISIPFIIIPFVDQLKDRVIEKNWIKDEFVVGNLMANGGWTGYEVLIGLLFLLTISYILFFLKTAFWKKSVLLWSVTLLFTFSALTWIVPKIEKYSQAALVEFIKSRQGEDAFIRTLNFKSYATYFYGRTLPVTSTTAKSSDLLSTGLLEKDVYFIAKTPYTLPESASSDIKILKEENGFIFYFKEKE